MPDLLIEVLSLEVRRVGGRSRFDAGCGVGGVLDEAEEEAVICELAPAWGSFWGGEEGEYFRTTPCLPDEDLRAVWVGDGATPAGSISGKSDGSEEPRAEPLVAFLIAVPILSGLVVASQQHLGIAIHPARPGAPSPLCGEIEVPLKPIRSSTPGARIRLHGLSDDRRLQVAVFVAWFPAPQHFRRLLQIQPQLSDEEHEAGPPAPFDASFATPPPPAASQDAEGEEEEQPSEEPSLEAPAAPEAEELWRGGGGGGGGGSRPSSRPSSARAFGRDFDGAGRPRPPPKKAPPRRPAPRHVLASAMVAAKEPSIEERAIAYAAEAAASKAEAAARTAAAAARSVAAVQAAQAAAATAQVLAAKDEARQLAAAAAVAAVSAAATQWRMSGLGQGDPNASASAEAAASAAALEASGAFGHLEEEVEPEPGPGAAPLHPPPPPSPIPRRAAAPRTAPTRPARPRVGATGARAPSPRRVARGAEAPSGAARPWPSRSVASSAPPPPWSPPSAPMSPAPPPVPAPSALREGNDWLKQAQGEAKSLRLRSIHLAMQRKDVEEELRSACLEQEQAEQGYAEALEAIRRLREAAPPPSPVLGQAEAPPPPPAAAPSVASPSAAASPRAAPAEPIHIKQRLQKREADRRHLPRPSSALCSFRRAAACYNAVPGLPARGASAGAGGAKRGGRSARGWAAADRSSRSVTFADGASGGAVDAAAADAAGADGGLERRHSTGSSGADSGAARTASLAAQLYTASRPTNKAAAAAAAMRKVGLSTFSPDRQVANKSVSFACQ